MANTDTITKDKLGFVVAPETETKTLFGQDVLVGSDAKVYALLVHAQKENYRFYETNYLQPLKKLRSTTNKSEFSVSYIRLLNVFERNYSLFLFGGQKEAEEKARKLVEQTIPEDLINERLETLEELEINESLKEHWLSPEEISSITKRYIRDLKRQLAREGSGVGLPNEQILEKEISGYIFKTLPDVKNAAELRPLLTQATKNIYDVLTPESVSKDDLTEIEKAAYVPSLRAAPMLKPDNRYARVMEKGARESEKGFYLDGEWFATPTLYLDKLREITIKPSDLSDEELINEAFKISKTREAVLMAELATATQKEQAVDLFLQQSARGPLGTYSLGRLNSTQKEGLANELVMSSARQMAGDQTRKIIDMMRENAVTAPTNVKRLLPFFNSPNLAFGFFISSVIRQAEEGSPVSAPSVNPMQIIFISLDLKNLISFVAKAGTTGATGISIKTAAGATAGAASKGFFARAFGSILGMFGIKLGTAAATTAGVASKGLFAKALSALGTIWGPAGTAIGYVVGAVGGSLITKPLSNWWNKLKEGRLNAGLGAVSDFLTGRNRTMSELQKQNVIDKTLIIVIVVFVVVLPMLSAFVGEGTRVTARAEVMDEVPPPDDPEVVSGYTTEQLQDPVFRQQIANNEKPVGPGINWEGPLPPEFAGLLCPVDPFSRGSIRTTPQTHNCTDAFCSNAYDIAVNQGTVVYATHDAYLVQVNNSYEIGESAYQSYGNYVTLVGSGSSGKYYTKYAHLTKTPSANTTTPGGQNFSTINQAVDALNSGGEPVLIPAGTPIGLVDDTGTSTGNHLHYGYVGPGGELVLPEACFE